MIDEGELQRRMRLTLFDNTGSIGGGKGSLAWARVPYGWVWVKLRWRKTHPIMAVQQRLYADSGYTSGMLPPLR